MSNGARYTFQEPRDVGAQRDYRMIFHFGENRSVRIDTDSIVEVFEGN